MTKNIPTIDPQEVPEITNKVSWVKLSQVAQAVNIVISQIPKAPLIEVAQLPEKSSLRTLVDIAERAHRFGSLKRTLSPEAYEKMLIDWAKHVQPFVRAIPFGGRDHERIQHIQYVMPNGNK